MELIKRLLEIDLPKRQSAFLWGARKTGKSTFLGQNFPHSVVFDFLKSDLFLEMTKRPALLRERLSSMDRASLSEPIILDEAQKIPRILDEVHWLIENEGLRFILCGSSARKLKRGRANLLGGRAWRFEMFPLVTAELGEWELLEVLNRGLIPSHYLQQNYRRSLRAYTRDYLKEEVFDEGLVRNLPAFSRFFDAMAYSHGELINYSNIARECGVDSKTVKEYFQILVDTLLCTLVEPFKKRQDRNVISKAPKFYLFDVGVAGAITGRSIKGERGELFGRAFEHFIFMELVAHRAYTELDYPINFWRTKNGMEVDFILARGEIAIEVKGSPRVDNRDLSSIVSFRENNSVRRAIVVCNEQSSRTYQGIEVLPYRLFLDQLWSGQVMA